MVKVLIRLGLITLLVYLGVTFWYGRMEKKPGPVTGSPPSSTVPSGRKEVEPVTPQDFGVIVTRNIFHATLGPGKVPGGRSGDDDLGDLAETKLQLVLLGTVTGSPEDARAIIRDESTRMEDIYQVGGEVRGAAISRIARGKVVLQVNGREEVLIIKEPDRDGAMQAAATAGPPRFNNVPERLPQERSRPAVSPRRTEVEQAPPEALPRRRITFREDPPPAPQEGEGTEPKGEAVPRSEAPPTPGAETPGPTGGEPLERPQTQ